MTSRLLNVVLGAFLSAVVPLAACHAAASSGPPMSVIKQTIEKDEAPGVNFTPSQDGKTATYVSPDQKRTVTITFQSIQVAPGKRTTANEYAYGEPAGLKVWPVLVDEVASKCTRMNPSDSGLEVQSENRQLYIFSKDDFGNWAGNHGSSQQDLAKELYRGDCRLNDFR